MNLVQYRQHPDLQIQLLSFMAESDIYICPLNNDSYNFWRYVIYKWQFSDKPNVLSTVKVFP